MRNSKRIKIVAGGTAALFGVGVAFAAWTSTGEGDGSVTAGSAASLTVAQDDPVSGLYPTGTEEIEITVTNANPYPVTMSSLVPAAVAVDAGHPACVAHGVTFGGLEGLTDRLAAAESKTYTLDVDMGADSDDGCQGATFTSEYTATAASSD